MCVCVCMCVYTYIVCASLYMCVGCNLGCMHRCVFQHGTMKRPREGAEGRGLETAWWSVCETKCSAEVSICTMISGLFAFLNQECRSNDISCSSTVPMLNSTTISQLPQNGARTEEVCCILCYW